MRHHVAVQPNVRKAILSAVSDRDESAPTCRDNKGRPEPDPGLRDTENVPLDEDIHDWFAREVLPHVPDAWINETVVDDKDKQIGKVGYELNLNRYFYEYRPPRPLEEIDADLERLETEIQAMLREVVA
jgi:type I restriction enzyme M protein